MKETYQKLRTLLLTAELPPDRPLPEGLSEDEIAGREMRLCQPLPRELRAWLSVVNGTCVGGQVLLGLHNEIDFLDIESVLNLFPEWKHKRWVPVAADGCGNYYVLVTNDDFHPVAFIDTHDDSEALTYLVASSLSTFLRHIIEHELGEIRWPFDKNYVLGCDPQLAKIAVAPLPWDA